ncbi:MAG: hypothetical protein HFI69_05555 [Lachnospiraceae bacterium]|nr:hypothetical protein [Lachnospiraceae bacterium]
MKNLELKKKFQNKYMIRMAAGALTVAVLGSGTGMAYTVHAEKKGKEVKESEKSKADKKEIKETLEKVLSVSGEEEEAGKEETVYVVAEADGTAKDIIVSEWLKNKDKSASLEDASDLKEIENVKGEETFAQNGDKITWQADGKDIYYQGTTDKELPITEKVTYFLDGKELSPEEMAGKSGKVTIRFDYTNHEKTTQITEGEAHEVYVPFTVLTGMILPEDYTNVEITNGKVISDGNRKVAVGLAMPGLKESLELDEEDLEDGLKIPDYVELTAEVENFSLEMTMTVVMNDLPGGSDLSAAFDLTGLEEDLETLTDASGQLAEGSKELSEGLGTLKNSMKEFAAGVNTLNSGIHSYTDGASRLNDGIRTLSGSSGTLVNGVTALNSSAATLNNGVAQLDQTLKAGMTDQEKAGLLKQTDAAIDSSFKSQGKAIQQQASSAFYNSLAGNQAAKDQVSAGLGVYTQGVLDSVLETAYSGVAKDIAKKDKMAESKPQVVQAVTQAVVQQVTRQVTSGVTAAAVQQQSAALAEQTGGVLNAEAVASVCTAVNQAVNTEGSEAQQQINALVAQQDINGMVAANVNSQMAQIEQQIDAALASGEGQAQLKATVDVLVNQTVSAAMANETLKAGMNSTADQIVSKIADGAKDSVGAAVADTAKTAAKTAAESAALTAVDGTKAQISAAINAQDAESGYSLVSGMQALSQGTQAMNDSMPALTNGIDQLTNGAAELVSNNGALTEGASKLSGAASLVEEGVEKLDDGSRDLMEGMIQFDEEGIQKLADAYDGDVKELLHKLESVAKAGKEYQTFSKVADGTKGSVKFIFRTEAVKADQQ